MRGRNHGFTLTEMLVVLGIILVVMGLLIPAIIAAQRQAKITQCQSRLRSIGQGLQVYMTEFDQTLPPGVTSNSRDSSLSSAALGSESIDGSKGIGGGLVPSQRNRLPLFQGALGFPYPAAPLAYYLKRTIPVNEGNWSCPTWRRGKPGLFRTYQFVATESPVTSDDSTSGNLAGGNFGVDEFRPGYMYMSGVEYTYSINKAKAGDPWHQMVTGKYHYEDLAARSISGLKLSEIKQASGAPAETVVTALDYSLLAHSKSADDPWDAAYIASQAGGPPNQASGRYTANFLFLDGHVERREFGNIVGFFAQLHGPIPQPW